MADDDGAPLIHLEGTVPTEDFREFVEAMLETLRKIDDRLAAIEAKLNALTSRP